MQTPLTVQPFSARSNKGGFFSESEIRFLNFESPKNIIPKNYPELEI